MTFFRPLSETAPTYDPTLPWPINGFAYVIMFMGPLGSIGIGLQLGGAVGLAVGVVVASVLMLANALLFDYLVEPILGALQHGGCRRSLRAFTNVAGFAWAISLCALSMYATVVVLSTLGRLDV